MVTKASIVLVKTQKKKRHSATEKVAQLSNNCVSNRLIVVCIRMNILQRNLDGAEILVLQHDCFVE